MGALNRFVLRFGYGRHRCGYASNRMRNAMHVIPVSVIDEYNRIAMTVPCTICRSPVGIMCRCWDSDNFRFMKLCHYQRYNNGLLLQPCKPMSKEEFDETYGC